MIGIIGLFLGGIIGFYFIDKETLKDLAPLLSAVAAGGSFCVAWRVKKNDELQSKRKFRKDLYCVVAELSNIIYYFQSYYNVHSTVHREDIKNIIDQIKNIDKKHFMIKSDLLYNDNFDEKVLKKINLFMGDYSAWSGYRIINNIDILTEFSKICCLKLSAVEAIMAIKNTSNDKKIIELLDEGFYRIDDFKNNFTDEFESIKYAGNNIYILFLFPMYHYTQGEQNNIVLNMVKCFLSNQIKNNDDGFLREKEQLFMIKDIDKQIFDQKKMKSLLDYFNKPVDN